MKGVVRDIRFSPDNSAGEDRLNQVNAEDATSGSMGPVLSYDTRDNRFFPSRGLYSEISGMIHPESFGNELDYYVIEGFLNGFHQFRPSHILAARLYGQFTPDDTPYSDLSSLGRRADLRGYVSGEHIANSLITLQLEYRY